MEKEWYYGNVDKERNGPVGFTEIKDLYKVHLAKRIIYGYLLCLNGEMCTIL